jgi:hypothetical protein
MSDVPELDKLIEEHAVFKFNAEWDRRNRLQLAALRAFLTAVSVAICCLAVGWPGLLALPFISPAMGRLIPDPPRRDPFKRYKCM